MTQHLGAVLFIIGQVTKNGSFAGFNEMPHLVTCHLHMKVVTNDKEDQTREWETKKNRAGPCDIMHTELRSNGHHWSDSETW